VDILSIRIFPARCRSPLIALIRTVSPDAKRCTYLLDSVHAVGSKLLLPKSSRQLSRRGFLIVILNPGSTGLFMV